jgi:ribosomal protein L33
MIFNTEPDKIIDSFDDYCPYCNKVTTLYVVNEKYGVYESELLNPQELECSECGTRWWV